jgi:hypothetical protein
VTALAVPNSNCTSKLQTRPLVREGNPQEEIDKWAKIFSMEIEREIYCDSRMVV